MCIFRLTREQMCCIVKIAHFKSVPPFLIEAEWRIYASSKLTSIGSDNGSSPGRRQAIIWTNAGILLTGPLGKFSVKL